MKAALIGVGQAGGKLADALVDYDRRAGFDAIRDALAINTAESDLESLAVDALLIGRERVNGHGVGGDNELGARVMHGEITEVLETLEGRVTADTDAVFLAAGLGGGTGSGGAPVLARALTTVYDLPVYGLGVLPGRDEGAMYQANAGRSLKTLAREVDALLLVDNDAWREEGESVGQGFAAVNEAIARRVGLLLAAGEASHGVGASVVDASEVINTLREGGIASLGYAAADASEESAENIHTVVSLARRALLSNASLPDATDAEAALLVVAGRPEAIPRKGVERARGMLEEETGSLQVRGGDVPLDDDDRLVALVLLGGVERSGRLQSFLERAREAQEAADARAEAAPDPVEAFDSEELDGLF